jgi:predicted GNAT family N-acyltransferase
LAADELPADLTRKLPRYPLMPATLLGRLAVDQKRRGEGWGRYMLIDALRRAAQSESASFAVVVDAKDESAAHFYHKEGFAPFPSQPRRLFLPMATIAKLFR